MERTAALALALGVALAGPLAPWTAAFCAEQAPRAEGEHLGDAAPDADADDDDLRQRLTEREDQRRPAKPWSTTIAGRPLTLGGEYELAGGYLRRYVVGQDARQEDRSVLEQELEVEAFYSVGSPLSVFLQARAAMEEDLLPDTVDGVSDLFVERGEMWLYSEDIAGSGVSIDVGRLDFEDDRRWWWDVELDAARLAYERGRFELTIALARELGPSRSDRSWVDPEHDRTLRWIGEASFDWRPGHAVELFLLHQDDRSRHEREGEVVDREREDDADGRLTWLGARAMGAARLPRGGLLGYWLDAAVVRGRERRAEYEDLSRERSVVEETRRRDVSGWGIDAGLSWMLPLALDPRLFAGLAVGSGDPEPESTTSRAFQQTRLQANEAGFGGVERFAHYGVALDPELSNLAVVTVGTGISLLRSSSLDLVYHAYRLLEPADELADSRLELALDGRHRGLGHGIDLVLALEEWERLELELVAAAFRAGSAAGRGRGAWSYGGFAAIRYAF